MTINIIRIQNSSRNPSPPQMSLMLSLGSHISTLNCWQSSWSIFHYYSCIFVRTINKCKHTVYYVLRLSPLSLNNAFEIHIVTVSILVTSFLFLNSILLCECSRVGLSLHPLQDIWVLSSL